MVQKQGMTRVFTPEGDSFAVSVVSVLPNTITQKNQSKVDGYPRYRLLLGRRKKNIFLRHNWALQKGSVNPGDGLWEFRVNSDENENLEIEVKINIRYI